jgi:hypothetical protein
VARFVEFCCFYGLTEKVASFTSPLRSFKKCLTRVDPTHNNAENHVLVLMPVRVSPTFILSLLDEMVKDMNNMSGMI